jgi:DNA-binding transcriptional LysR family regulator
MEIGQLEAFERVAREGNFTRAAEALGLTQPAVSTRIALLEEQVGGALFERRGRQQRLTILGKRLLPYAERILAVINDAVQEVEDFHSGKVGEVKIAALAPFVLSLLPNPLETFRIQYPSIDIHILQRVTPMILDMLYDGVVTLGMLHAPLFDQNIRVLARFQEPIRGVVAPHHPLAKQQAKRGVLSMKDVYKHTIFRVTMSPRMTAFIDSVVEQGRHGSGGAVVAVPMIMVVRLVMLGQGIAFLPQSFVKNPIEEGNLEYLNIEDMPPLMNEPLLVVLKGRQLDNIHQDFIHILIHHWRDMLVAQFPLG